MVREGRVGVRIMCRARRVISVHYTLVPLIHHLTVWIYVLMTQDEKPFIVWIYVLMTQDGA